MLHIHGRNDMNSQREHILNILVAFGLRLPGTLVWAISSMSATWGFGIMASTSISSTVIPRYSCQARDDLKPVD